jgi:uncharacterized membrane protein (DUF485 family)
MGRPALVPRNDNRNRHQDRWNKTTLAGLPLCAARKIVEGQLKEVLNNQDASAKIASNPKFAELVSKRTSFAWTLTALMMILYYGFVLLVAYNKPFLAQPLAEGSMATVGFPIGVGVILASIALTGIYVRRANGEFDELNRQIIEESR